jgi:hypothetical protein
MTISEKTTFENREFLIGCRLNCMNLSFDSAQTVHPRLWSRFRRASLFLH